MPPVYKYAAVTQGTIENYNTGYCLIFVGNLANGKTALFMKGSGSVEMISGDTNTFSTTKDTTGKINIYNVDEYNFSIQQNMAGSKSFRVLILDVAD